MLYTTETGATYPESLKEFAIPLPEILHLHTHISGVAVGGFVFLAPGSSLLLIRRSQDEPAFPGYWEVPGGGVESPPLDATLLDAVVREVKEETGLTVTKINQCFGWVEFEGRTERWRKWNFEVEVAEPRDLILLAPGEHDAWMWIDGEEALEAAGLQITSGQRESLLKAFRVKGEQAKISAAH